MHRPLGRVEDLARELVSSLPASWRRAPSPAEGPGRTSSTANRGSVSDGDRMIPLTGLWGGQRFIEPGRAEHVAGHERRHRGGRPGSTRRPRAVEFTASPKGLPADRARGPPASCCARCSAPTSAASRTGCAAGAYDDTALDAVYFAWAGTTEFGGPALLPDPGPGLLIELDNTQRGANHAHSVWRDPEATSAATCSPSTTACTTEHR